MNKSYEFLKKAIDQRVPIYGINTQFGDQVTLLDENFEGSSKEYYESIENRQKALINSHCCGLGDVVLIDFVRVAMILRAHCLSQGYSGVKYSAVNALVSFYNHDINPIVRQFGSIGASGDLIPLASIATAIIGGNTEVVYRGKIIKATQALKLTGLQKYNPQIREGLAMINGTTFMTAIAALAVYELKRLFDQMLTAIALSLESLKVIDCAYHPLVHEVKRHKGEIEVNNFVLACWRGSQLITNINEARSKLERPIQDYYSLRSVSQGFGPFFENLDRSINWIENEINSVNDNPIIDLDNAKIHHGANFMGYYITDACDLLKMNIAQAATWIHALLAVMVHPRKNNALPANLVKDPSNQNGFRPLQLLAASITVQCRKLAQCHQSYMLPTEGDNQDVNSLGTHAAFDLQNAVTYLDKLTAILYLAVAQALELRGIEKISDTGKKILASIRKVSPTIGKCRPLTNELNNVVMMLREEKI